MGRWPVDKYILDVGDPDGHYDLSEIGKWAAGDIAERHNADCAAYENQIADLEQERDAAVEFAHTVEREFAAATATLERLREVVREDDDEWQDWEPGDLRRIASAVHAILYPQRSKT